MNEDDVISYVLIILICVSMKVMFVVMFGGINKEIASPLLGVYSRDSRLLLDVYVFLFLGKSRRIDHIRSEVALN